MSLRKNFSLQSVNTAKCPAAKCTHGEVSSRRNARMANCPTANCPTAESPTVKSPVTPKNKAISPSDIVPQRNKGSYVLEPLIESALIFR